MSLDQVLPSTIYGMPLDEVLFKYGKPVPPIVKQSCKYLQPFMNEEGIFRLSGLSSHIIEIGELFLQGSIFTWWIYFFKLII